MIQEWISYLVPDDGRIYVLKDDYAALEATFAEKDREIALWKQSYNAASKDNEELREENAGLVKDIALNVQLLARQADLAREAETEAARYRAVLEHVQRYNDIPEVDEALK